MLGHSTPRVGYLPVKHLSLKKKRGVNRQILDDQDAFRRGGRRRRDAFSCGRLSSFGPREPAAAGRGGRKRPDGLRRDAERRRHTYPYIIRQKTLDLHAFGLP
jgi:hypothetical protein